MRMEHNKRVPLLHRCVLRDCHVMLRQHSELRRTSKNACQKKSADFFFWSNRHARFTTQLQWCRNGALSFSHTPQDPVDPKKDEFENDFDEDEAFVDEDEVGEVRTLMLA